MEQNNIENQFRDKLSRREIKPSANSWDRLDAMLTLADPSVIKLENQKPKRNLRWIYFAASFLGFILIATVFLSQTEEVIDVPTQKVVLDLNEVGNKEEELRTILEIAPKNNATSEVATAEKAVVNQKQKEVGHLKKAPFHQEIIVGEVADISTTTINPPSIITREQRSNLQSIQKTNVTVDANALLASVDQKETIQVVAHNSAAIKVNTSELLSKVASELELSFRERVIQSVNKKYKEVKVAVTNRNLE
jgi:hypothetical protein